MQIHRSSTSPDESMWCSVLWPLIAEWKSSLWWHRNLPMQTNLLGRTHKGLHQFLSNRSPKRCMRPAIRDTGIVAGHNIVVNTLLQKLLQTPRVLRSKSCNFRLSCHLRSSFTQLKMDQVTVHHKDSTSVWSYRCICNYGERMCCAWRNYPENLATRVKQTLIEEHATLDKSCIQSPTFKGVKFICPNHPRVHTTDCILLNEANFKVYLNNLWLELAFFIPIEEWDSIVLPEFPF